MVIITTTQMIALWRKNPIKIIIPSYLLKLILIIITMANSIFSELCLNKLSKNI